MNAVLRTEIETHRTEIARICERLGVRRLELFGSGTRTSAPRDLDFLADLGIARQASVRRRISHSAKRLRRSLPGPSTS